MSNLIDNSITIYEALKNIENGKYVMPAFQRQFVWSMEQIEKLWDSILLNYPISTFLFWHVDDENVTADTYFCKFLYDITFDSRKSADSANYDLIRINPSNTNTAILDGQQRFTSLFVSLFGTAKIRQKHARKKAGNLDIAKLVIELDKNKTTTDEEEYNSKKYDIRFSDRTSPTHFELKNILEENFQNESTREAAIEDAIAKVSDNSKDYARKILHTLYRKIFIERLIRYTEITDMSQDDALEMFVRFNSGGKPLKKSEITMSILEAYWPSAKTEFGYILEGSYKEFGSDFIIRAALMLYGEVAKSNINRKIADDLKNNWSKFKIALANLEGLLIEMKTDISRFSGPWNVLLPILYYIYYNKDYANNIAAIRAYLLRAIFFIYFRSGTTGKLQQIKTKINDFNGEITIEMLNGMSELSVTPGKIDDVLNSEKGSRVADEVLYYLSVDWLDRAIKYEQDHLHPDSKFNLHDKPYSISPEDWKKWRGNRNRLPNLHMLEGKINASKNDMPLVSYFNSLTDENQVKFYERSIIPENISLEIDDFDKFYEARKKLLLLRIRALLG
ncbi:MAG: DUF262 domain-containing protein [Oscillospiraceae bacterium]|nr:DUF262 domain-containing protein [Oscillospiraceae bacterium]